MSCQIVQMEGIEMSGDSIFVHKLEQSLSQKQHSSSVIINDFAITIN